MYKYVLPTLAEQGEYLEIKTLDSTDIESIFRILHKSWKKLLETKECCNSCHMDEISCISFHFAYANSRPHVELCNLLDLRSLAYKAIFNKHKFCAQDYEIHTEVSLWKGNIDCFALDRQSSGFDRW